MELNNLSPCCFQFADNIKGFAPMNACVALLCPGIWQAHFRKTFAVSCEQFVIFTIILY
jgi:hypothetical protein